MENYVDYLLYAIGVFTALFVGLFKIGLNTRRAQRLVRLIGEAGARIFYIILGTAIIILTALGIFS
jgi:hypothetical protein